MICRIMTGVMAAACLPAIASAGTMQSACLATADSNICIAGESPTLDLVSNPVLARHFKGKEKEKRLIVNGDAKVYLYGQGRFMQPLAAIDSSTYVTKRDSLARKALSFYMVPRACFFQHERQQGLSLCSEPGADMAMPSSMDRKTSSIRIPKGIRVYASYDRIGTRVERWYAYDDSDVDMATLAANGQQDSIRKIKVARTRVGCDRGCPIGVSDSYALDAIFGDMWNGPLFDRKTFQFTFRTGRGSMFEVSLDGHGGVSFVLHGGVLYIYHAGANRAQFSSVSIASDVRYLSLAIELITNEYIRYQVIGLDHSKKMLGVSPIFSKFPNYAPLGGEIKNDPSTRSTFTIKSRSQDVQIENLTFAVMVKPEKDKKRSAAGMTICYLMPILAIYNYVTSGVCNQPDRLYRYLKGMVIPRKALMLHVAGDADAKPRDTSVRHGMPAFSKTSEILMNGRNQFQAYGIARACRLPMEIVLVSRDAGRVVKRGTDHHCLVRTQDILSAFNRVFGDTRDASLFNRVIANIIETGSTGHASSEPQAEQHLVNLVLASARQQDVDTIGTAILAYSSAASLYYASALQVLNPEDVPDPGGEAPDMAPSDAEMVHAPLGEYRLDLQRSVARTIPPRRWQGRHWVATDQDFTTTVFPASQARRNNPAFAALYVELQSWASRFDDNATVGMAAVPSQLPISLRRWGYALSTTFVQEATQGFRLGSHVVAVYFRGRLVSMLLGEIREGVGEVISIVSHPQSVLKPYTESSLRGGGSRALEAFIALCRERNVRSIAARAVTPPSATMHARLGFRLADEL